MEQMSAAILCGGKSRRMGQNKARLPWEGRELLDVIAQGLTGAEEILLAAAAAEDYADKPYQVAADLFTGCGPLAGLHAALTVCRAPLLFITACDTPLADWNTARILHSFLEERWDAAVPVDSSGRLHPLCGLYRKRALPAMAEHLEAGQYRVTEALHALSVCHVPAGALPYGEDTLKNLNTPEEYQAFLQQWRASGRRNAGSQL